MVFTTCNGEVEGWWNQIVYGDYRNLNSVTEADSYYLPRILDRKGQA